MATKYKTLAELLRSDLLAYSDGERRKLPTEAELVRRYRVSRQTVRHALKLLTDEGLVESVQGSGTYAVARKDPDSVKQIAVVTSFLDDYIFPTILHDAQTIFAQAGYRTSVYATENQVSREREILTGLLEHPVCGILVEGSKTALPSPNSDLYEQLRQLGTPILFLHGAYAELSHIPCVSDDNYGGGHQLAQYLIEKGHRDIAGIFKSDDVQGPSRYHGAISAIRDAGLTIHDRNFWWYDTQDRVEMLDQHNLKLLHDFLTRRVQDTTALICYNDEIAHLVIQVLLCMGRRVPEDMAVVSFDNSYYSQIGPVHITSLAHRTEKMGRAAAEQLFRLLRGERVTSSSLDWTLIERESG